MARWDAHFYYLDWRYFNKLDRDFWDMCLDDEGQVRAEYRSLLQEEEHVSGDLTNWKVSREACELYEQLRGQLPSAVRVQADTLFSQLFAFADSDYWPGFAGWDYSPAEGEWLKKTEVNHLFSPQKIKELLPLWQPELAVAITSVMGIRPQDTYLNCVEAFLAYLEEWIELLKRANQLGNRGLLVLLS